MEAKFKEFQFVEVPSEFGNLIGFVLSIHHEVGEPCYNVRVYHGAIDTIFVSESHVKEPVFLPGSIGESFNITTIRSKWHTLSDDEKNIMGRPNFACGKIAHRMRAMGFEVAEKAEEEQALVIWAMLEFYKKFGKDWSDKMNEFLKNG